MLPANPVSSHAHTVPAPASLGSDSTATSVKTVATLKSVIINFDGLLPRIGVATRWGVQGQIRLIALSIF